MAEDPHKAENDPESTTEDVLYSALLRLVKELEAGWYPGIGSHGQAYRAMNRYQSEHESDPDPWDKKEVEE